MPDTADFYGFYRANVDRAVSAGLEIRAVGETSAATWRWLKQVDDLGTDYRADLRPSGISPEQEADLLARAR